MRTVHWADATDYASPCGANSGEDRVVFTELYRHRVTCRQCLAELKRREESA